MLIVGVAMMYSTVWAEPNKMHEDHQLLSGHPVLLPLAPYKAPEALKDVPLEDIRSAIEVIVNEGRGYPISVDTWEVRQKCAPGSSFAPPSDRLIMAIIRNISKPHWCITEFSKTIVRLYPVDQ